MCAFHGRKHLRDVHTRPRTGMIKSLHVPDDPPLCRWASKSVRMPWKRHSHISAVCKPIMGLHDNDRECVMGTNDIIDMDGYDLKSIQGFCFLYDMHSFAAFTNSTNSVHAQFSYSYDVFTGFLLSAAKNCDAFFKEAF